MKRLVIISGLLMSMASLQVSAQNEGKEVYAIFSHYNETYTITYPDGTVTQGKFSVWIPKNLSEIAKQKNAIFNDLGEKGFTLVTMGTSGPFTDYVFKKTK